MQSAKGTSYDIGYSIGYFIAATWPFLLIGLAAFIAFVSFKYWNKKRKSDFLIYSVNVKPAIFQVLFRIC